jgi:Na+/proline symporter
MIASQGCLLAVVITLHLWDWVIVGLYGVGMLAIAFWAMRKIKDCGGFLLGKRKMGKLMMMAQTFAGGTNANHPMAVASATYKEGLSGMWLSLTWMLITPFFWMYPPVLRRLRIVTIVDLVQHRFGRVMATIFKMVAIIGTPISMGFGVKSAAIVVEVMTGGAIHGPGAILVIVVPTVIYTLMGGVIAAYATDVVQGLMIVVLSFLLIPFAIARAGGIAALDAGIADQFTQLISTEDGNGFGFWWIFWFMVGILFSATVSTGGGAPAAQNEMAARSAVYGLIIKRFCTLGWGLVGLFAMALYAGHDTLRAEPDKVFAFAAGDLLPVVFRGVMVASMLAAVMSSLDAMMIGFAGMVVKNIYEEYFVKGATPQHYLLAARLFALVGVVAGWWVASSVKSLVDFATFVEPFNSLTGVAILVALVWRRTTRAGAIASVAVMFPLFVLCNHWDLVNGLASLPVGLRHAAEGLQTFYAAIGYQVIIPTGKGAHLPVELKNPLYLLPGLATIVLVSLFTRQHSEHAVKEFYARLDTPLGDEHKLREQGYHVDDLDELDGEGVVVEKRDHDISRRLLLLDVLRLPGLLKRGEAKLADYRLDWYGLFGFSAFVVLFIVFINWIGSFF